MRAMPRPENVTAMLLEVIQPRAARAIGPDDVAGDVALGGDGLGLDSIAIAEVLIQLQERSGIDMLPLLERSPLTLRHIAEQLSRAS